MNSLTLIWRLIRQNSGHWWLFVMLFSVTYYLILMGSLVVTFENFPNYVNVYNWPANAVEIFKATPSLKDSINILSEEWLLEIGYMNYDYGFGISEWSLNILPFKCLLVMFLGAILITQWRLWKYFRSLPCAASRARYSNTRSAGSSLSSSAEGLQNSRSTEPGYAASQSSLRQMALASGAGTVLVAMANMTMFWVVCCASPSWVVGLAMLGLVSVPVALILDPWEIYVTLSGFSLLLISLFWLARAAVKATSVKVTGFKENNVKSTGLNTRQATQPTPNPTRDFANV